MNKVKDALSRFWTRARGIAGRGGDRDDRPKSPGGGVPWRLIPLACALAASIAVFASLTQCESGAYGFPMLRPSWCGPSSRVFGFMSTSAGVGFLIFLIMEVATMIFAQMWKDRQLDRAERREEAAERRAEAAERMAEVAERMAEAAERRAELAERARREDAERAERRAELAEQRRREDAERAERREQRLIELLESLKNGKDDAASE